MHKIKFNFIHVHLSLDIEDYLLTYCQLLFTYAQKTICLFAFYPFVLPVFIFIPLTFVLDFHFTAFLSRLLITLLHSSIHTRMLNKIRLWHARMIQRIKYAYLMHMIRSTINAITYSLVSYAVNTPTYISTKPHNLQSGSFNYGRVETQFKVRHENMCWRLSQKPVLSVLNVISTDKAAFCISIQYTSNQAKLRRFLLFLHVLLFYWIFYAV